MPPISGGFFCMDANSNITASSDPQQQVSNPLEFDNNVLAVSDPMSLDISDKELADIVKTRIENSQKFFEEKYNLSERRKKHEKYLFGRQVSEAEKQGKYKDYETRSSDNALYEIEASLKPISMQQLPDIIITPGGEGDPQKEESAKNLSIAIDDMNKKRKQREILGLAFKHLPVYLTGVLKARWNSEKGIDGDMDFDCINPEYIVVDETCTTKNEADMSFIAQVVPMTVQDLIMKFPSKKDEIIEKMKFVSVASGGQPTYKDLATEVKIWEVWFDWYKKKGTDEVKTDAEMQDTIFEPGVTWEKISGTLWQYEDLILKKMLDPNFDHVGEDKYFSYQSPGDESTKQEVQPQDIVIAQLTGQQIPNLVKEKIYHNYFSKPRKPYYFFGYDQWGRSAYDETSRIEQNIRNQENLDSQNSTLLDQLKKRVKHIWSKDSGLGAKDIQRMDMDNPKMDALVEGDPNTVHAVVTPERPDQSQFNALQSTRDRMHAIAGSQAITGQLQSDVATNNQIGRENNFTRTDDLVEDTINPASEWLAEWQMQFIKLRYTQDHMRQILGSKGQLTYIRLRRDMISDGMEVMIKSSSTDKLKAQRNAMETAKLGPPFTNPIDFFQDMDMNDPEGRTERGIMFQTDPQGYFTKFVLHLDNTQQQAAALTAAAPAGNPPLQQPNAPMNQINPQNPTPGNTSAVPIEPPTMLEGSPRAL